MIENPIKESSVKYDSKAIFLNDVISGLSSTPKTLSSKYIYDAEGSKLFEKIMKLDEYYLTKSEHEILVRYKKEISAAIGNEPFNLVELGAGNGEKTRILLQQFIEENKDFQYRPVDISAKALSGLKNMLSEIFPGLVCKGIVAEYFDALRMISDDIRKSVILFLGSNIGNFKPDLRYSFFETLNQEMNEGDLLVIGFDLKKDVDILNPAYNDSKGVTAAFNENLLKRINRELGGDFISDNFKFYSRYNPLAGAIESFLMSTKKQTVYIGESDQHFYFDEWEPIHTESSYKYSSGEIESMAGNHGFKFLKAFYDERRYFSDVIWER